MPGIAGTGLKLLSVLPVPSKTTASVSCRSRVRSCYPHGRRLQYSDYIATEATTSLGRPTQPAPACSLLSLLLAFHFCSAERRGNRPFVFGEVSLDDRQVEGGQDAGVAFAPEEEFERLFDQLVRRHSTAGQFLVVVEADCNGMRRGRPTLHGDLERRFVDLRDLNCHYHSPSTG